MGTIRPEFQNFGSGEFMSAAELAAMQPKLYDACNPSPSTLAKVAQIRNFAEQVKPSNRAAPDPVKDRAYYRQRWMAGFTGRRECLEYAKDMGMNQGQFSTWLWSDEPQPAAPSATPEALAWAEQVLEGA